MREIMDKDINKLIKENINLKLENNELKTDKARLIKILNETKQLLRTFI